MAATPQTEDLQQRTKALALRVIRLVNALPKSTVAKVIGYQILKSGTSVGANYHEAVRSRSRAEFLAKTGDCFRELSETRYWLELLTESRTLPKDKLKNLLEETDQLAAIFYTIIKNTKANTPKITKSPTTRTGILPSHP